MSQKTTMKLTDWVKAQPADCKVNVSADHGSIFLIKKGGLVFALAKVYSTQTAIYIDHGHKNEGKPLVAPNNILTNCGWWAQTAEMADGPGVAL